MIRIATPTVSQVLLSEQTNFFRPLTNRVTGYLALPTGSSRMMNGGASGPQGAASQTSSNATR